MKKRIVIFDLDGTLLNTIADLGQACNHALAATGFSTHSLDSYPYMVGNGITRLIERALPPEHRDDATVAIAREHFLYYYGSHCMDLTRPYPGIPELLRELAERGIAVAVASNKYQEAVTKLIGHFFPDTNWVAVEGHRLPRNTKPDPAIVYDIERIARVTREEVLYAGDSGVDMDTAANALVDSVGVTWGFRPESELRDHGACHIAHHPDEILLYL